MRHRLIAWCVSLLIAGMPPHAHATVSVSIGIHVPAYPRMALVPGYPVYYAPAVDANFFFYDGMYWVLVGDSWYMSSWYNGPWRVVAPAYVPYYLLRVPVRYYKAPPPYFQGWRPSAAPRWGNHWGPAWEQRHRGWDQWNHRAVPGAAPLPSYQRGYSGPRYPSPAQQADLQHRNYRYQPRAEVARQFVQEQQVEHKGAAGRQRPAMAAPPPPPRERAMPQHELRGPEPPRRDTGPRMQPQQMPPPPQQGRPEPQERGRGKGHGDEGRDRREEGRPPR